MIALLLRFWTAGRPHLYLLGAVSEMTIMIVWPHQIIEIWLIAHAVRPSKKKKEFLVRVFEKNEKEGLFIFYFLFFKMADI